MNADQVLVWCRTRPGASEELPFGPDALVFKVGGKMFAIFSAEGTERAHVSLKCDPRFAEAMREQYSGVRPGYHLSKRHWNTVTLDGSVPAWQVEEMLGHSYTLVRESLPKAVQAELG